MLYYNQKRKGEKKMTAIDFTQLSYHAMVERKDRIEQIEKTISFGTPIVEMEDTSNNTMKVLTSTGVIVIWSLNNKSIVTMFVASVNQALSFYNRKRGEEPYKMPRQLWLMVNYNNNTYYWQKISR